MGAGECRWQGNPAKRDPGDVWRKGGIVGKDGGLEAGRETVNELERTADVVVTGSLTWMFVAV